MATSEGFRLSRREWLRLSALGVLGAGLSGWMPAMAHAAANDPKRKRSCILLWMDGGPSQMDTFDLKPGNANGGPYQEIQTSAPGLRISEHLPKLAKFGDKMAVIRSMTTKEADHGRGAQLMHTGYLLQDRIHYPTLGALMAKELMPSDLVLPAFVSIAPNQSASTLAHDSGFLGPAFAPLIVGDSRIVTRPQPGQPAQERPLRVQNLELPSDVLPAHLDARVELLREMEKEFVERHPGTAALAHQTASERALKLSRTAARKAFNLDEEKDAVREAYGRNLFGQGCLLARRLVERGVPFVEVSLGGLNGGALGWDTHVEGFEAIKRLSQVLDAGWASLMGDLKDRGLLDTTLIVWMGEFGRTPRINAQNGRDHYATAWSTVLAGGGIKGGQAVGRTSANGMAVEERPVSVPDLLGTVGLALGVDPEKQNESNVNRPIRVIDKACKPIKEVLE